MIESREYPFLRVALEVRNFHESVPAFVDTGFDGFLILPERYLPQLGSPDFVGRWSLADGSTVEAAEFRGAVQNDGLQPLVQARITCLGTEVILGRAVVDRFSVTFDHGQHIIAAE